MKDIITNPDIVLGWSSVDLTAKFMSKKLTPGKLCQLTDQAAAAVFEKLGQAPLASMNTYVIVLKAKEGTPFLVVKQSPDNSKPVTVFAGMHGESQVTRGYHPHTLFHLYFGMAAETKVRAEVSRDLVQTLQDDTLVTLENQIHKGRDRKHDIQVSLRTDRTLTDAKKQALNEELKQIVIPIDEFIQGREAAATPYLLAQI